MIDTPVKFVKSQLKISVYFYYHQHLETSIRVLLSYCCVFSLMIIERKRAEAKCNDSPIVTLSEDKL